MGPPRKSKPGSKSKSSKKTEGKTKEPKKPQPQLDANKEAQLQLLPQDRVLNVKPCWATTSNEGRVELLSISLEELRLRAIDLAEKARKQAAIEAQEAAELDDGTTMTVHLEPGLDEVFDEGTRRLLSKSTWKLWQWPPEVREFFDADSFRQYAEEHHIDAELRKLLPRDEGKPIEKPAERALRERMAELLQKVHATNRQLQETQMQTQQTRRIGRRDRGSSSEQIQDQGLRDSNIELITIILEALEKEHEYLYNAVLYPVTHFVCEMLPEQMRESTRTELFFDDLEKLPSMEVARICEWLTEKVDGFSSKTRAEPKEAEEEEEEEGIGDVDLFTLSEDQTKLSVNVKWLQHLQERLLGEDGHPRKVHDGEDPNRMGLVLEWVYGTIVSTAEKARDGAKRPLGMQPPTVDQAHEQLIHALQDMQQWETRAKQGKDLLNDMLKSRREAAELATKFDIRPDPRSTSALPRNALLAIDTQEDGKDIYELPDHVIVALLKREHLLTKAKLNALCFEHIMGERRLRSLKTQLRQGEPEFDRLKRELEEVKNQPRGLEGTFRTAAEMERHRAQLADAAIEEQLEVQTAFREHGARLQGIYDKRQRTEHEMVHREQEIKQLQGWAQTVQNLVNKFEDALQELGPLAALDDGNSRSPSPDEEAPAEEDATSNANRALARHAGNLTQHRQTLAKLRLHFQKDVRRQLYADEDDRKFFNWVQGQLKSTEKRLEDGRAVLHHLEAQLINVACDDPGAAIGAQLALPLLQERLDAKAQDYARQQAAQAEQDIIKMEEDKLEKERAERERKLKQKQKAKDRVRTEKEKLAAEKEAAEKEARERSEELNRLKEEQTLAAREAAAAKRDELKKAEEQLMEARRQELLSEEDGYWRQRMDQQQLVEKLKAEVAEQQEELKGHSEDGTEDSNASASTPADDASESNAAEAQKASHELESQATAPPTANGFCHTNDVDSDGFKRTHDRRTSALPNGRLPHSDGVPSQDGFGRSQGRAEPSQRGRSNDVKRDSFAGRPSGTAHQGDQADRFAQRRFGSRDSDRTREVPRPRRDAPQKEATKPLTVFRHPDASRNTVMASKGADGRIAITAEAASAPKPASAPHTIPHQERAPSSIQPQHPVKLAAVNPSAPSQPSPTPALTTASVASAASKPMSITPPPPLPSAHRPAPEQSAAPSISREHFPALPEIAPPTPKAIATPAVNSPAVRDASIPAASPPVGTSPPGQTHPEPSPVPVTSGGHQGIPRQAPSSGSRLILGLPNHQPQQPSVVPQAQSHQSAHSTQPTGAAQSQIAPQVVHPAGPASTSQPSADSLSAGAQMPNGFISSQLHQQQIPQQASQPGIYTRPQPQQQHVDRGQPPPFSLPPPIMTAVLQQNGSGPLVNGSSHVSPSPPLQSSPPSDSGLAALDDQITSQQAQQRPLHQGPLPQSARSGSFGVKRPMPVQDHQQAHPSQQLTPPNHHMLGPQLHSRGSSAGPPMMSSPYNSGQLSGMQNPYMHPNHNLNSMPSNGSLPMMRMQNGMVPGMYPQNMMTPNQRPTLNMHHMMAMANAMPKQHQQQQGGMPYPPPNQYMMQMGSGPMSQVASGPMPGPHPSHPFPANNPQPQSFHPREMPQQPHFSQPRPAQPLASIDTSIDGRSGAVGAPTLTTSKSLKGSALRADAPSFVPGGFAPPSPAPQAQQSPSAALLHQAMQARAFQPEQQPAGSAPAAGLNTGIPAVMLRQEQPSASTSGHVHPSRPPSAHLAGADSSQAPSFHPSANAMSSAPAQEASAYNRPEPMAAHQPPSSSLQPNPSAAIMSEYHSPMQAESLQAAQQITSGRASGHASTATGVNLSAAQSDLAGGALDRQAGQGQASSSGSQQSLQGDSPKARCSAVAANQDQPGRPRGVSPPSHEDVSSSGQGHGRAGQMPPASTSGRSAQGDYSRTDSNGSMKDSTAASRDRRPSGAAPGVSAGMPQSSSTSSLSSTNHKPSGQQRRIVKKHGLVYEDRHDGMRRLKLVRGLSNMFGQYNCFLNVIIQSLWHLPAFRQALLTLPINLPESNGASPKDAAVVRALHNVFAAFAKNPSADEQAAVSRHADAQSAASSSSEAAQQLQQHDEAQSSQLEATERDVARQSVSPDELREALSQLGRGHSPVEFELSEMHDAAEVLGEVFNCLHRAQLGSAAARAPDPGLPQVVRVPRPGSSSSLAGMATPLDPSSRQQGANSMVQDIFGQKVQVPCPADDVDSPLSKRARAEVGQWQQQQSRATASQQRQQAQQQQQQQAAAKRLGKDANLQDMHQFWKYFHLVPAQAVRVASDSMSKQGSFEAVLREADSAEALLKRRSQVGASPLLDVTLLSQPKVFTLAIVWESAKVAEEAITSTVDALSDSVNLSQLFKGVPTSSHARFLLKSIICYFGHHYQVYALSEELEQWLLFDDTNIQLIGDWQDVKARIRHSRLQPSVLFYERLG